MCRECLLWAAHGGDLKTEKEIDFSVMEPDNRDPCRFLSDKFDKAWLTAMTQEEEQTVDNLTSVSEGQKGFSGLLSKKTTIDMIAKRYGLTSDYVDGNYSIIFRTRPPMHWDSNVLVWKFGTMSQMIEKHVTGKEVCVVCTRGSVKIH